MTTPVGELLASIDLGPELHARVWTTSDAAALVAAWTDADIARWNPVPAEPSPELAERWIAGVAAQDTESRSVDVVVERSSDVAGEVGLQIDRERRLAEVGFWVGPAHRRRGVGAALLAVAEQVAPTVGVDHLIAVTDATNEAAIGLLERCGWVEVRTTTHDRRAFARSVAS